MISEISSKIKKNGVAYKTGQLGFDDKENYKECMKEHVEKDENVYAKEYEKTQRVLNALSLSEILWYMNIE